VTYYTVTFVDHDDAVLSSQTVEEGTDATAPTAPTRTGYRFIGWDTDFTKVISDLEVKAVYEPLTYSITFAPGTHGAFTSVTTGSLAYGTATPAPPHPIGATGWTFDGWSPAPASIVTGNATYTATWKATPPPPSSPTYTVAFLPGDHGAFTTEVHRGIPAQAATPAPPVLAAHEGWLFDGWSPALTSIVTGDVTYTATWRADPSATPTSPSDPSSTPAPTSPSTPTPAPDPIVIINNSPAQPASADRYVTVTGPAAESTSSSSDAAAGSAATDTSTIDGDSAADAEGVELPDADTPLASGQGEARPQGVNVWLVISLVVFALVTLIAMLLMLRRPRDKGGC
jgi:hypothetical protein